jgi:hypothetical protein
VIKKIIYILLIILVLPTWYLNIFSRGNDYPGWGKDIAGRGNSIADGGNVVAKKGEGVANRGNDIAEKGNGIIGGIKNSADNCEDNVKK